MTATDEPTGPAVPPALPPRIYRNNNSFDVPRSQPLKPQRKSKTQESPSISGVITEAIYEDPDALLTPNQDVTQPEAKPRPIPRIRSKDKLNPQHDTNNASTANYINTINSGHNNNTAYVTKPAFNTNTTQTTNRGNTTNSSSSTYSTDKTYDTETRAGDSKNDASYQRRRNSDEYMIPRPTRQPPLPPVPLKTKDAKSTAADSPEVYNTITNSSTSAMARDVKSKPRASPSPRSLMHHSSSFSDLSSIERQQNRKDSNDYMTPRSARQALLPPLPPGPKGPYSTAADASQDHPTRTNSNTSVKNPPPLPPPRLHHTNRLYCDKGNPTSQHRDNRNRHGSRSHLYHSASVLDLSSDTSSETSSLYDPQMEPYCSSGSSLYTDGVNPPYTRVLPNDYYESWISARRNEDDNQSTYSDIYQLTQDDITELLQWFKRVSRQSDTMSLYGLSMEDEMRSFHQQAKHVRKARRLYHLLMMKRKEHLQKILEEFKAICEKLEKLQKANKTMGIAGGTTSAVGGVAAVVGIALAPVTMGASLIATAVGAGIVATSAGSVGAKVAKANKKIVNRETVEKLVNDYKSDVVDLERCLNYILCLMKELQRHNISKLQRAGAHPDALRMADLSQVVSNNFYNNRQMSPTNPGGVTSESMLKQFEMEFDEYFTEKKGQKLNKSNKSKFSGRVGTLVKNLQEELTYLTQMWEVLT